MAQKAPYALYFIGKEGTYNTKITSGKYSEMSRAKALLVQDHSPAYARRHSMSKEKAAEELREQYEIKEN